MKRWLLGLSLVMVVGSVGAAWADMPGSASHKTIGLGFHRVEAPVGLRWWFSGQKVALDLGLGFTSDPSPIDTDEAETSFAIEAGVPFVAHSWERAHFIIRPGILYQSEQVGFDSDPGPGFAFDTENQTTFDIMAELEAEVFLVDNVSVSAAHGIGFRSFDPAFGGDSQSSFRTFGNNFTTIGFHAYILP